MVGRGGAVLAVPALVYVVGLGVHEATTVSLAVVAGVAATGAIGQVFIGFRRFGRCDWAQDTQQGWRKPLP